MSVKKISGVLAVTLLLSSGLSMASLGERVRQMARRHWVKGATHTGVFAAGYGIGRWHGSTTYDAVPAEQIHTAMGEEDAFDAETYDPADRYQGATWHEIAGERSTALRDFCRGNMPAENGVQAALEGVRDAALIADRQEIEEGVIADGDVDMDDVFGVDHDDQANVVGRLRQHMQRKLQRNAAFQEGKRAYSGTIRQVLNIDEDEALGNWGERLAAGQASLTQAQRVGLGGDPGDYGNELAALLYARGEEATAAEGTRVAGAAVGEVHADYEGDPVTSVNMVQIIRDQLVAIRQEAQQEKTDEFAGIGGQVMGVLVQDYDGGHVQPDALVQAVTAQQGVEGGWMAYREGE